MAKRVNQWKKQVNRQRPQCQGEAEAKKQDFCSEISYEQEDRVVGLGGKP